MKPLFDRIKAAKFGNIKFPWVTMSIKGSYRHHVHQYRHTNAGSIEKQGRHAWVFTFDVVIDEGFNDNGGFGNVTGIPQALTYLYANGITNELTVPMFGTIPAMITDLDRRADVSVRSGERISISFIEDKDSGLLVEEFIPQTADVSNLAALLEKMRNLMIREQLRAKTEAAAVGSTADASAVEIAKFSPDLLDSLTNVVNSILAVRDQVDLVGTLVLDKLERVALLCQDLDRAITFDNSQEYELLEALKEIWFAATVTQARQIPYRTYSTPEQMTVQQVSVAIYGVADRAMTLLALNIVDDPFAIPAGTVLKYTWTQEDEALSVG